MADHPVRILAGFALAAIVLLPLGYYLAHPKESR